VHVHFLDPYQPFFSPIHTLDGRVKLLLIAAYILTCALAPVAAWPAYLLLYAALLALEILSGLGIRFYLKRAALAAPFVLAALPLLFTIQGRPLAEAAFGPLHLAVTVEGIQRFASIALKSWFSVQAAILLTATTPFPDLLLAMRALRIPRLLVAMIGMMWRYLFVLADEALRLIRARESRSGESSQVKRTAGRDVFWRARVTGGMAGSLFLRSIERGDRIYLAMLSRGYDGEIHSLGTPAIPTGQRLALGVGLIFFGLVLSTAVWLGGG